MEAKTNLESRRPSRHVTEGPARAPHRSCDDAMGMTDQQIHQPFIGVASCWNEAVLENAAAVGAASGGSTNAALHLPAIAHECGIAFDLFDVAEIFKRTPYIADLKPGSRFVAKDLEDLFEVGGIPLLIKTLPDNGFLHGELEQRRAAWRPRGTAFGSGYIWKYAQQVGPARHGAVTHLGGSAEKACHVDI